MKKTGFASPNFPRKLAAEIHRMGGMSHDLKHMAEIGRKGGKQTQRRLRNRRHAQAFDGMLRAIAANP